MFLIDYIVFSQISYLKTDNQFVRRQTIKKTKIIQKRMNEQR